MTGQAEAPARGEPDELRDGGGSSHPTSGGPVWKSLYGTTGGWGCERATFYRETVRDERGYRLSFPVPEPVVFGIAVDEAHRYLTEYRADHGPVDATTIGIEFSVGEPVTPSEVADLCARAVRHGVEHAQARQTSEPIDWPVFTERVGLAAEKALGLWPNRVEKGEPAPEPEGTPPGPPIGWLDRPGLILSAQRRLHAPGVVGGRGMSGRPDYVLIHREEHGSVIVAWVDVKALSRAGSYPAKWAAGEAVAYDLMVTAENAGILPEWHGYLEYRRVQKPYWALVTAPVHPSVLGLAEAYDRRWSRALDDGDPDGLTFDPRACGKCDWRDRIEGLHPGCPIGGASVDVAPPNGSEDPAGD